MRREELKRYDPATHGRRQLIECVEVSQASRDDAHDRPEDRVGSFGWWDCLTQSQKQRRRKKARKRRYKVR